MEFYFEKSFSGKKGICILLSNGNISTIYNADYDELGKPIIWRLQLDHPFLLDNYAIGQAIRNDGYETICFHGAKIYFEAKTNHCLNTIEIKTLPLGR